MQHYQNRGKKSSFVGKYYCYKLIYYEFYINIDQAIAREKETPGGVHRVAPASQREQVEKVKELKQSRDNQKVSMVLQKLRKETEKGEHVNLMPAIMEAVSHYATRGEIMGTIRQVYGHSYDPLEVVESPF